MGAGIHIPDDAEVVVRCTVAVARDEGAELVKEAPLCIDPTRRVNRELARPIEFDAEVVLVAWVQPALGRGRYPDSRGMADRVAVIVLDENVAGVLPALAVDLHLDHQTIVAGLVRRVRAEFAGLRGPRHIGPRPVRVRAPLPFRVFDRVGDAAVLQVIDGDAAVAVHLRAE